MFVVSPVDFVGDVIFLQMNMTAADSCQIKGQYFVNNPNVAESLKIGYRFTYSFQNAQSMMKKDRMNQYATNLNHPNILDQ